MLTREDHGRVVGHITIPAGVIKRELYECAAWYRDHALTPGTYPVTLNIRSRGTWTGERWIEFERDCYLTALDVPSTIVGAYLGSLFGGVPIGPDRTGPREIGQPSTCHHRVGFAYTLEELNAALPADLILNI